MKIGLWIGATLLMATFTPAQAEDIVVSSYGSSTNGFPYAVAMEKGFFKQAGADVTGIVSSSGGGGSEIRTMMAGNLPYADLALASAIAAIQQSADISIVSDNQPSLAAVVWITMPNSPIKSLKDLKGKKLGYSGPQSTSQTMDNMMLDKLGYKPGDVQLISTGGFGPGLTAMEHGAVDVVICPLPDLYSNGDKFRILDWADRILPPMANVVGVSPRKIAQAKPDFVKGVIEGRRMAIRYMADHRDEATAIASKVNKLDPTLARKIIDRLLDSTKDSNVPYWGDGNFHYAGFDAAIQAGTSAGIFKAPVDIRKYIDESYLPADLRSK